jgi:hypothetical protein
MEKVERHLQHEPGDAPQNAMHMANCPEFHESALANDVVHRLLNAVAHH